MIRSELIAELVGERSDSAAQRGSDQPNGSAAAAEVEDGIGGLDAGAGRRVRVYEHGDAGGCARCGKTGSMTVTIISTARDLIQIILRYFLRK